MSNPTYMEQPEPPVMMPYEYNSVHSPFGSSNELGVHEIIPYHLSGSPEMAGLHSSGSMSVGSMGSESNINSVVELSNATSQMSGMPQKIKRQDAWTGVYI